MHDSIIRSILPPSAATFHATSRREPSFRRRNRLGASAALAALILLAASFTSAGFDETAELYTPGIWCDQITNMRFGNSVAVGDLNGDGFDDVAVACIGAGSNYRPIELFYGQESGEPIEAGDIDRYAESVAILDLDGDGFEDLVLGYFGFIEVFYGASGAAPLPPPAPQTPDFTLTLPRSGQTRLVAVADRNGDGYEDLVIGVLSYPPAAYALLGFDPGLRTTPDGPYTIAHEEYLRSAGLVGDVNDDGCPERTVLIPDDGTGQPAVRVVTGSDRRRAWGWGYNLNGQIGDGTTTQRLEPVPAGSSEQWSALATGSQHTLALGSDGSLWAWGDNASGQLGDGSLTDRLSAVPVAAGSTWRAIAAGTFHSLAIRGDGTLWAWGSNGYGQLGRDDVGTSSAPVQVGSFSDWIAVGAGRSFSFGIRSGGALYAWGQNNHGQLGLGTTTDMSTPSLVASGTGWVHADGGQYHAVGRKADGSIWAWGNNSYGEIGDGTTIERHTPVAVGTAHTWAAIDAAFYSHYNLALRTDGTLWAWGSTGDAYPTQVGSDNDWLTISAGYLHSACLKTDGTLWAWGSNFYGQLGNGTTTAASDPILISAERDWAVVVAGNYSTHALRTPDYAEWQVSGVAGQTSDWFGEQRGAAGDVDGDGYGDFFVTDPWYDGGSPGGYGYWGRVHVWFGGESTPTDPLGLGTGQTALTADILLPGGYAAGAHRFVAAGDIDGDSFGDLAVGDRRAARQCFVDDTTTNIVESGSVTIYVSDAYASPVPDRPADTALAVSCRPNPFNPRTTIVYETGRDGAVEVAVYDARGRLVRRLLSARHETAGRHEIVWDGRDEGGRAAGSGLYFCRVRAAGATNVTKVALLR